METTDSLLKGIISTESQYSKHKIERNLLHLQRQIDVLISKTSRGCSLKFFNPSEVLPAECIACLVNLVSDQATKPSLLLKCILLFNNLVTDNHIRECLYGKSNLTVALVGVIVNHGASTSDTLTAEAMQLLQKVTYGQRISFEETYMEDLVRFLMKNIVTPATGLTQPAMGILVNLTRDNFSVQSFIKNNEDMKEFARTLIKLLGDQTHNVLLFSLTLLLNVCLAEKMAAKFYNEKNAPQTFQMVFNVLIDGQPSDTRRYAVDLFKDILKVDRLQKCLASYEYLRTCIEQILNLLSSSSHESVNKIFELLQLLCLVKGVRRIVCKAIFATFHIQDPSQFASLVQTPLSKIADPLLATIHWAGQSTDTLGLAPLGAYDLLIEVYEEQIFSHNKMNHEKHVSAILPTALHTLQVPLDGDNPTIARRCLAMVKCVKLLSIFCDDDNLLTLISKQIDPDLLPKLIYFQFDHNSRAITTDTTPRSDDWSNIGVDLVINLLDLIARIKSEVLENFFFTTMQIENVVPFLACGLCSTNRQSVNITLNLIQMCSKLEGFQSLMLVDALAHMNACREKRHQASVQEPYSRYPNKRLHLEDKENIPMTYMRSMSSLDNKNGSSHSDTDINESVQSLTERMNNGLDFKDVQNPEIVAVYERSLQAMQTKEQHLQDLLEAKTLSLTQADRMLAQYRARKGQDDAECNRLRTLLIHAEKKCKGLDGECSDMRNKIERSTKEIEELHTENLKLKEVAQMHQQLTAAHTELTEKYERGQKAHLALRQEHKSLSEMHEMLQKHNNSLKHQFDTTMEQLTTLQEEMRKVSSQLKTAETKLEDTKKASLKWEYEYKRSEEEREVMDTSIETLRKKVAGSEAKKKELLDQVSQLEFACNQNEQKIGSYENEIKELHSEIAKHRQITALINSLSSGNSADNSASASNK